MMLLPATYAESQPANAVLAELTASEVPNSEANSTSGIALFINKKLVRPQDRVLAAYYWVTHNIRYDRDSMYAINAGPDPQARIRDALRRKKGVCENFAAIFSDICRKCGMSSYVVDGYTSNGNRVNKSGHSWSAVFIENQWLMYDPTWDESYSGEPLFFAISPEVFVEDHLPFDPIWQLTNELVTPAQFYGLRKTTADTHTLNLYLDSLPAFLLLDELQQYRQTARRMRATGIVSELARVRLEYINMKIGIGYEDHDIDLYNAAINDYNKALRIINSFVIYRNLKFLPARPDKEILALIAPAGDILLSAMQKLDVLLATPEQFETDASVLNSKLSSLTSKLHQQELFLKFYLSQLPSVRERLFYSFKN